MSTDKMREAFESWAIGQGLNLKKIITGVYRTGNTSLAWKAWKESRAALVVDIPPRPSVSMFASIGEARCAQDAHDRAVNAIEESGVRVK